MDSQKRSGLVPTARRPGSLIRPSGAARSPLWHRWPDRIVRQPEHLKCLRIVDGAAVEDHGLTKHILDSLQAALATFTGWDFTGAR